MPKIIKTIQLKDTPAEKDYDGCGHSCLVLKNGVPQKLIYSPDRKTPFSKSFIAIDPNNIGEIQETTEAFTGMTSCYEFNAFIKIFPF